MKCLALFCLNRGGLYQHATQLVTALAATGRWEILFVTSKENPAVLLPTHPAVHVLALDAPHRFLPFLRATVKHRLHQVLWNTVHEFHPDCVHVVDAYPWYLWWARRLSSFPLVVTVHDPTPHTGEYHSRILSWTVEYLTSQAQKIIVHSASAARELSARTPLPAGRVVSIPLGGFEVFARWRTGAQPEPGSLIFFGRILPYKGIDVLLQAFATLVREGVATSLTVAGEGNPTPYQHLVRPEMRARVRFENRYIPEEEVAGLIERHQVVVLPYREATQSAVVGLAFALGRPVVASDAGAIAELVVHEKTGLLVPPGDHVALARTLRRLLTDGGLWDSLVREASAMSATRLSWHRLIPQYEAVYRCALENPADASSGLTVSASRVSTRDRVGRGRGRR